MNWLKVIYTILINLPAIIGAFKNLVFMIQEAQRKAERDKVVANAKEKYLKVLADPNATDAEIGNAYADYQNSIRS